ncbi:MAG: murein biosynthesis integral rane protein MurJ, partial [Pseudomonadota bacterium]
YLYYADRVAQLPLGVIGAALGTALLPLLARHLRLGEKLSAHRALNRGIELAVLLTLPCAAGLAVAAGPITAALFQRGAFDAAASAASAAALVAYAAGLPAFVLVKVFAPAFFARGDTSAPVRIGILSVAVNLALNLAFMNVLGHVGVALATSIAAWVNGGLLAWLLLRRGHLVLDRRCRRVLPRLVLASVIMAALVFALGLALEGVLPMLRAGCMILLGMAAFTLAGVALGAFRPRDVLRQLRRKTPRSAAPANPA